MKRSRAQKKVLEANGAETGNRAETGHPEGETQAEDPSDPKNKNSFYVVGIGASAGGLEALEAFFDNTPPETGMAFVVVQHLSPDFKSVMDELLARHTEMKIFRVEDRIPVEPNSIYLIPPKMEMVISNGKLLLTDKGTSQGLSLPIDLFFRSLAQDVGERAVAVVLSGSGTDGSRGVVDVHKAGGLVMVQDPDLSKFDGMPQSAIASGVADFILPPEAMPETLARFIRHPLAQRQVGPGSRHSSPANGEYGEIFARLREEYGIDFAYYKSTTVSRRVERRIVLRQMGSIAEYAGVIAEDRAELNALYRDLLIGVTSFFRDPDAFSALAETLPGLIGTSADEEGLRVWVPGCATGEEAYSVAILLHEALEASNSKPKVKIFATDVHRESLDAAAAGLFSAASLENVSDQRLRRHFIQEGERYQVRPELRQMIVFAQHDVLSSPPFTKLDLISCRNLLIYLQPLAQKKVLSLFHFALRSGGVLFLGPSEVIGEISTEFTPVHTHWKIFTKRRDVRLPVQDRLPIGSALSRSQLVMPTHHPASTRVDQSLARAYDALLEKHVPASLLLNERREVVHTFGDAGRFLRLKGRVTADVLSMVEGDLRVALSTAIQRALKQQTPITYKGVRLSDNGGEEQIKLVVDPLPDPASELLYLHVSFEPMRRPVAEPREAKQFDLSEEQRRHISELEEELRHVRENWQAAVEELETSNEELQTSNEELLASNEELQSTNEELHSVNEELYTVNAEHERKINELMQLTRDMDNLLTSTEIGTIFLDMDLSIRKFTPAIEHFFNLLPQDVGRPINHLSINLLHDQSLQEDAADVIRTGEAIEKEVQTADGTWFLKRVLPYRKETGDVDGVVLTFIDISRVKGVERRLSSTEERFRAIFDHAGMGMALVDGEGHVVESNPALQRLLGYSGDELRNLSFPELTHPEDVPADRDLYRQLFEGRRSRYQLEKRYIRKDGALIWGRLTVSVVEGSLEAGVHAVGMVEDITEQKMLEREILQAKELAEAASSAKSRFLANMSHEIRTPISGILGMAEILQTARLGDDEREYLEHIKDSARHLLQIINDILDLSKIEAGMLELDRRSFDLRKLLGTAVETCRVQSRSKDLQVEFHVDDAVPAVLRGDPVRLAQVVNNLLSNAVKFTERGNITIGVEHKAVEGDLRTIQFAVSDTGPGIPADHLDHIFEEFTQGDASMTREHDGVGLGLAISRRLVEAMGGRIWAASAPGAGSTFTFTVQLQGTNVDDVPAAARKAGMDALGELSPLRVLLAEDNEVNALYISHLLERAGHDVATARNGEEALRFVRKQPFDLVIMDVQMPGVDGIEATRAIREGSDLQVPADVPIVALTANAMKGDRERLLEQGMTAYVAKPVTPDELARTLLSALEERRQR